MTLQKMNQTFYQTSFGNIIHGDSLDVLSAWEDRSVDLIVTSPPYALLQPLEYGNVHASVYSDWFKPFARQFHRILKDSGSLVIDIGGAWVNKQPTRSLYHFKLLIMLCEEFGFHLAQDLYWWNPCRIPNPSEWVTIRKIRVSDAVNTVWWLSRTPWPKASNRRILQPSRASLKQLFLSPPPKAANREPSSDNLEIPHGIQKEKAIIPTNLIALANRGNRNTAYINYCRENNLPLHPARFPPELPEFFVRMLTDPGDTVVDPFGGSCITGEVCQRLKRKWYCIELSEDYLKGALGRFKANPDLEEAANSQGSNKQGNKNAARRELTYYVVPQPGYGWDQEQGEVLDRDGGKGGR